MPAVFAGVGNRAIHTGNAGRESFGLQGLNNSLYQNQPAFLAAVSQPNAAAHTHPSTRIVKRRQSPSGAPAVSCYQPRLRRCAPARLRLASGCAGLGWLKQGKSKSRAFQRCAEELPPTLIRRTNVMSKPNHYKPCRTARNSLHVLPVQYILIAHSERLKQHELERIESYCQS